MKIEEMAPQEESLMQIRNGKGELLLDIPYINDQRDFTSEELFEIIAKQTESYWREKIAGEIESDCDFCREDIWCGKDVKNQDCSCKHHQDAAMVRKRMTG